MMKRTYIIALSACICLIFSGLQSKLFAPDYHNRIVKEMEHTSPAFIKRSMALWEKQSRIVGELKNTPAAFTIELYAAGSSNTPGSKPLSVISPNVNLTIYDTGWIATGTYDVVYKSEGYVDHRVPNLKLSPYTDCVINLYFGTVEYRR